MTAEYKRELLKNTLIIKNESACSRDNYQVKMIEKTPIPLLLSCKTQMMDGELFFQYDVTGYQSLAASFSGRKLKSTDIKVLLRSIVDVFESTREYLLDSSCVLIDPGFVFLTQEGKYGFCYVPGSEEPVQESFDKMAEFVLDSLEYHDKEAVVLGYEMYRRFRSGDMNLSDLLELVQEKNLQEAVKEDIPTKIEEAPYITKKQKNYQRKANKLTIEKICVTIVLITAAGLVACVRKGVLRMPSIFNQRLLIETGPGFSMRVWLLIIVIVIIAVLAVWIGCRLIKTRKKASLRFREVDFLPVENPTVLLEKSAVLDNFRKLVDMKNQDEIYLKGDVFYVGKIPQREGLVLTETTISRTHARISKRDGQWYIEDCGSANGTFVNGQRLDLGDQLQLLQGDEVRFADKDYLYL